MASSADMIAGKFTFSAHCVATVRIGQPKDIHGEFTVRYVTFEMTDGSSLQVLAFSEGLQPINVVYEPAELTDADRAVAQDVRA